MESKRGHKQSYSQNHQTHGHTEEACGFHGGGGMKRDGEGTWGWLMETVTFRMDNP